MVPVSMIAHHVLIATTISTLVLVSICTSFISSHIRIVSLTLVLNLSVIPTLLYRILCHCTTCTGVVQKMVSHGQTLSCVKATQKRKGLATCDPI